MQPKLSLTNCRVRALWLQVIVLCFFLQGCRKQSGQPQATFSISAIAPAAGPYGTEVTITGSNFSNNNLSVYVNNAAATVTGVTTTSIKVIVPRGAGPGYISVQQNGEKVQGPAFEYEYTVTVSTVAGLGIDGYKDGPTDEALLFLPRGIAMDSHGNIFVADHGNYRIRKISPAGMVTTIAGNGTKGYKDGPASDAEFYAINGLAMDGNDNLYISDGSTIRRYSPLTNVINTVAGSDDMGNVDSTGIYARFVLPFGISTDAFGDIILTDVGNSNVRKITGVGNVSTLAGSNPGFADGLGKNAQFNMPGQVTVDNRGNVYIADGGNFRIRKMSAAGEVYTYAGDGTIGYVDGRFFKAEFAFPTGITTDTAGNVYECGEEQVIRKITPQGDVTTIAGTGAKGYKDGPGAQAMFDEPIYMFTAPNGSIYVADQSNSCIRRIDIE